MYRNDQLAQSRIDLAKQAVRRTETAWGPTHKKLLAPLQNLGDLYFALGQYQEAEQVCDRLLSIATRNFTQDHPVVAGALKVLGEACEAQGLHIEAENFYLWSLAACQNNLDHESETSLILVRLLRLYRSSQETFKARIIEKRLVRSMTAAALCHRAG